MGETPSIVGRVLAEKYLIVDRLDEGGFGSIWRAEHQLLKSPVAVKLIDLGMAAREGAVERFLREAQATAALRSPHVVQILDYGLDRRDNGGEVCEQPFIVMELLEGENLAQRIARLGKLSPLEAVRIVTHVARAMSRAHELGIVHRDLKPENIFLVNGDEEVAKVLDFGVAKIAGPRMDLNTYTQTGSMVGTPYYMSPEQAQGNKAVDQRSDLWSLGVITFEMLTGQRPFDSDALGDLVLCICVRDLPVPSAYGSVPEGFDTWFAKAVARDPEQRFQSARELALGLLAVVESTDGEVRYTQFDDRSVRPPTARTTSTPNELLVPEIPSRPHHSAFAATVRDDGLARSLLGDSATPLPTVEPPPVVHAEHLGPWSLFGMGLLALAAGAAAVYGLFYLLRDPTSVQEPSLVVPSSASTSAVARRAEPRGVPRAVTAPARPHPSSALHARSGVRDEPPPNGSVTPSPEVVPTPTPTPEPAMAPTPMAPGAPEAVTPVEATGFPSLLDPKAATPLEPSESSLPATETIPVGPAPILADPLGPPSQPIDALPMATDAQ